MKKDWKAEYNNTTAQAAERVLLEFFKIIVTSQEVVYISIWRLSSPINSDKIMYQFLCASLSIFRRWVVEFSAALVMSDRL